jgi:uncharacterized protein YqjF (DUF2071 family)
MSELAAILRQTHHRPWPLPDGPWVTTQTWHDLLFAHWTAEPNALRALVPTPFELDLFNDQTWLGIVPFRMSGVRPRAVPAVPWISAFPELNVRTYVRVGRKPGVYFFSLDAARLAAVIAARVIGLPYYWASMSTAARGSTISYSSRRVGKAPHAALRADYAPVRPPYQALPGTLDHFLTERYCLYAHDPRGRPYRLEIHHPPWDLQPAVAEFAVNTMSASLGLATSAEPLLHFSKRQRMVGWMPEYL